MKLVISEIMKISVVLRQLEMESVGIPYLIFCICKLVIKKIKVPRWVSQLELFYIDADKCVGLSGVGTWKTSLSIYEYRKNSSSVKF